MKIPDGYQTVMPYLILSDASGFLSFTKKVFNAVEKHLTMSDDKRIRHAEVDIGGSVIMFADYTDQYEPQPANLFVYVGNADNTYKIAVEAGASVINEPSDQSYGRTCGVKDPSGNTWWITSIK